MLIKEGTDSLTKLAYASISTEYSLMNQQVLESMKVTIPCSIENVSLPSEMQTEFYSIALTGLKNHYHFMLFVTRG